MAQQTFSLSQTCELHVHRSGLVSEYISCHGEQGEKYSVFISSEYKKLRSYENQFILHRNTIT